MITDFKYGKDVLKIDLPDNSIKYSSNFDHPSGTITEMLADALLNPDGGVSIYNLLQNRKHGNVVIVVSDITRPIPYYQFLPFLLNKLEEKGVNKNEIIILIATGMHRPSTRKEQIEMFGEFVVDNFRIIDHEADNADMLVTINGTSQSGMKINMNKYYVKAGFRIVTGLVEPHFMAGFSGGRKAICPGLVSLSAIEKFHGFKFLSSEYAKNANLTGNPCHIESESIAALVPPDYSINVILDNEKKINNFTSGELTASHQKAIKIVKGACCPVVNELADLVITSCGGHPLDTTFYQCVKGMVTCLPVIRQGGIIIAFGSCSEGIGSAEYTKLMLEYSGRHNDFLYDISQSDTFVKDQWEFQMQCRTLEKAGEKNLFFFTDGIAYETIMKLSVNSVPHNTNNITEAIQLIINQAVNAGKKIACIPEGPYCAPIEN